MYWGAKGKNFRYHSNELEKHTFDSNPSVVFHAASSYASCPDLASVCVAVRADAVSIECDVEPILDSVRDALYENP